MAPAKKEYQKPEPKIKKKDEENGKCAWQKKNTGELSRGQGSGFGVRGAEQDKDERNEVVPRRVGQNILLIVCKLRYKVDADDGDDVDILRQYLVIAQDAKCQLMAPKRAKWGRSREKCKAAQS